MNHCCSGRSPLTTSALKSRLVLVLSSYEKKMKPGVQAGNQDNEFQAANMEKTLNFVSTHV